jgi:hypothetical protein
VLVAEDEAGALQEDRDDLLFTTSVENRESLEIDGAMPPKPFSIAVYRASSLISWGVKALYGSSANQE